MENAIRFGLGGLCLIILWLGTIHYRMGITLDKLEDDLNKAAAELDDISDQVARISATMENYYD